MKQIALMLCSWLWYLSATAQQQPEGLGDFRINMDRHAALDLLTAKFGKPADLHHYYSGKQDGRLYHMAKPRNKAEFNPYYYDCAVVEAYAIPLMVLAAIPFRNVVLTFGNDRLLRIEADGSDRIDNAFSVKYGTPESNTVPDKTSCTFDKSGTLKEHVTSTTTLTWRNDNIYCAAVLDRNVDSDCQPKVTHSFLVESKEARTVINNCQANMPGTTAPLSDSTKARLDEL